MRETEPTCYSAGSHLNFLGAGSSYAPGGGQHGRKRGSSVTTLKPVKSCSAWKSVWRSHVSVQHFIDPDAVWQPPAAQQADRQSKCCCRPLNPSEPRRYFTQLTARTSQASTM